MKTVRQGRRLRTDSGPFSMVPLWIHQRGLMAASVAVYCVLCRYASMGTAFP